MIGFESKGDFLGEGYVYGAGGVNHPAGAVLVKEYVEGYFVLAESRLFTKRGFFGKDVVDNARDAVSMLLFGCKFDPLNRKKGVSNDFRI